MVKLVIFDLDGTLTDAYEAINKSVNFTLRKLGYQKVSSARIRKAVGWGDEKLLFAFIDAKDINSALAIYRKHHRWSLERYSYLLPYAKELLNRLAERGLMIAIASNRPTEFTNIVLKHLKIKKYFDYVLCADKLRRGKPHPEILLNIIKKLKVSHSEVVYVGDMVIDVETAHKAGVKAIAVSGGSSSIKQIKKAKPFKIIKSLASLETIFV